MCLKDFVKKHVLLNLTPQKNLLGKDVIGYGRVPLNRHEKITQELADEWLSQDIEKARKFVSKYELGKNDVCVFLAFYVGRENWNDIIKVLKLIQYGENTKAALTLTNSRFLRNNPSLGGILGSKIVKGERTL